MSKMRLIPKVNARLIFDVERHGVAGKERSDALLFRLFRFSREILGIEIDNVDVPDPVIGRVT